MKQKDSKQRLFEVMEKLNPEIKNEQYGVVGQTKMSGDARQVERSTTPVQQTANSRINTPEEFVDAFRWWFTSLGFNPEKNPIPIGRVTTEVTK